MARSGGSALPDSRWETKLRRAGLNPVAGVDEAGRGCLAGPVVAAAVILSPGTRLPGLNDSKKLSLTQREQMFALLSSRAEYLTWAWSGPREIDRFNILQATFMAMRRALSRLPVLPAMVLVDGSMTIPGWSGPQEALIRGDGRCRSIAAAGVVAKVVRDRLMERCHNLYPQFGFNNNRGYGTPDHLLALMLKGPCPLHRRSFAPVAMTRQGFFLQTPPSA
ncbi:MAG: ribonuclease HII [Candidatus Eisenbacteria bacterium]|uniref:Ribonuclease HII n=1 Tax=Eiseniibacteriota bacterium TaxID=2212470 RepID=A0A948RXG1_UNCEI|nr:ribonuclease HII [Candidatus Eisenbacteria bacterium]MBU1950111.1 ribonuclease HII [Candidatus Eisenbacteria bacterium]MBU2691337.1 ribonuclease HII [Candidatus Eisenbacteria bacterium]